MEGWRYLPGWGAFYRVVNHLWLSNRKAEALLVYLAKADLNRGSASRFLG
jgi:hypothetical protein